MMPTRASPAAVAARPLAVALVTETFAPEINGVAMTLGRLVDGLLARGHRVELLRPRQRRDEAPGVTGALAVQPLPGWRLPMYRQLQFGRPAPRWLLARWRAAPPDLVHIATEGPLGASALFAARRLGLPVVAGFHTNFHAYSRHYGWAALATPIRAYLRAFHRRCDCTLAPTEELARALAADGFGAMRVLGRGIDTALFHPGRRSAALRAEWGLGPTDPAVLHVGRFAPEKNLELALAAFAAVRAVRPGARLILAGEGPLEARLRARVPAAVFCGPLAPERLAAHYASADLFVFPSLTETFGNVTLEAMASGLPVLAFRYAAAARFIDDGVSGCTVPPGDAAAFVACAGALAADDEWRERLGRAARAAVAPAAWGRVLDALEAIYDEIIDSGGRHHERTRLAAGADAAAE
ncbi:glycosyltransferase family 4 protein [Plasticicumulans lactativorans]|uniref:glycosyltransferase family 4 protein n=1 Tax=Plasticicumulans lactativorans TaxID=1133106 RepID=UPI001404B2AE|nr:glycosyltransferase family 1 protein [Plasticicumulans lactativorans]